MDGLNGQEGTPTDTANQGGANLGADGQAGAANTGANGAAAKPDGQETSRQATPSAKPEWLTDEAFWDKDKGELKAEALFKSRQDLRSQVSRGLKEAAPAAAENYTVALPDGLQTKADDPAVELFKQSAHKVGISQKDFGVLMADFVPKLEKMVADKAAASQVKLTPEQEQQQFEQNVLAKVNPDIEAAKKQILAMDQFFLGKHKQGVISKELMADYQEVTSSLAGVRFASNLVQIIWRGEKLPIIEATNPNVMTKDQFAAEVQTDRYKNDPAYRADVKARFERSLSNY
ncbi:MAG: hypothetical protein AB7Q04_12950 [Steroidobacteraceae bacterium]